MLDGHTAIGPPPTSSLPTSSRPLRDYRDHYTFDLTGNRLAKSTDLGHDATDDELITFQYDANDRLLSEAKSFNRDPAGSASSGDPTGSASTVETTTVYGYDHTQQTSKTVYTGDTPAPASRLSTLDFT